MVQKTDLRVRRTLAHIRDAFLALVIEEGFDNLTVRQIAARAGVNRATFYRHYQDKYDLAERLLDVLFQFEPGPAEDSLALATQLFHHIGQHAEFYLAAVGRGGIPQFRERILRQIELGLAAQLSERPAGNAADIPPALVIRYLAAAQAGFAQWWLENGRPFAPEVAAEYLLALHRHGGVWALGNRIDRLAEASQLRIAMGSESRTL